MPSLNFLLGDPNKRELKRYQAVVDEINELEEEFEQLTDAELRAKTDEFRQRLGVTSPDISHGQSAAASLGGDSEEAEIARAEEMDRERERAEALDELLPDAFAVVREASKRTLGMRH